MDAPITHKAVLGHALATMLASGDVELVYAREDDNGFIYATFKPCKPPISLVAHEPYKVIR